MEVEKTPGWLCGWLICLQDDCNYNFEINNLQDGWYNTFGCDVVIFLMDDCDVFTPLVFGYIFEIKDISTNNMIFSLRFSS